MPWFITSTAQGHFEKAISDSVEKWGRARAEKYFQELLACFEYVAEIELKPRNLHQEDLAFGTGYKLHLCAHRYIVYENLNSDDVMIVAIFHKNMDIPKALRKIINDHTR